MKNSYNKKLLSSSLVLLTNFCVHAADQYTAPGQLVPDTDFSQHVKIVNFFCSGDRDFTGAHRIWFRIKPLNPTSTACRVEYYSDYSGSTCTDYPNPSPITITADFPFPVSGPHCTGTHCSYSTTYDRAETNILLGTCDIRDVPFNTPFIVRTTLTTPLGTSSLNTPGIKIPPYARCATAITPPTLALQLSNHKNTDTGTVQITGTCTGVPVSVSGTFVTMKIDISSLTTSSLSSFVITDANTGNPITAASPELSCASTTSNVACSKTIKIKATMKAGAVPGHESNSFTITTNYK